METQQDFADYNFNENFSWHKYNESQMKEKALFIELLRELCDLIEQPKHDKGRKPVDYSDMIYALGLKTYLTFSSRRVHSDLKIAVKTFHIDKPFHFNTLLKYLENRDLKFILTKLVEVSALPLKQIELDFAIDSTGFSTSRYILWKDIRNSGKSKVQMFRKAHCVYGVKTNVITSINVTEGYMADSPQFEPLIKRLAKNWEVRDVLADKAYSSKANLKLVVDLGGFPYIPFKSNATRSHGSNSRVWRQVFDYFQRSPKSFMMHYHQRSNAESGFSMIKRRFGNNIRCKKEVSQDNEILLKCLCHNLCVLIQEIFLNSITINFNKCEKRYKSA